VNERPLGTYCLFVADRRAESSARKVPGRCGGRSRTLPVVTTPLSGMMWRLQNEISARSAASGNNHANIRGTPAVIPSSSSLTSLLARWPSSLRVWSICLVLAMAALSSAETVHPMAQSSRHDVLARFATPRTKTPAQSMSRESNRGVSPGHSALSRVHIRHGNAIFPRETHQHRFNTAN
jgi:hypothetical protein